MVVVYDPELGRGLSGQVTAASGFNALAHAIEALYSSGRNPTASLQAVEAVRLLGGALSVLVGRPGDIEARTAALLGAPGRVGDRHCRHRLAAQARSRAGRSARPAPCRGARRAPALRNRIQPICGGRPVGGCGPSPRCSGRRFRLVAAGARLATQPAWPSWVWTRRCWMRPRSKRSAKSRAANPRPVDQRGVRALLADAYAGRSPRTMEEDGDG